MATHDSKPQILENAEPRKNIGNLKRARHAQAVDGTSVQAMYRIYVQKNLAGRRPKQTRNQMKQRGLSRDVGADEGVRHTERKSGGEGKSVTERGDRGGGGKRKKKKKT